MWSSSVVFVKDWILSSGLCYRDIIELEELSPCFCLLTVVGYLYPGYTIRTFISRGNCSYQWMNRNQTMYIEILDEVLYVEGIR